jgi:hypothetical protein
MNHQLSMGIIKRIMLVDKREKEKNQIMISMLSIRASDINCDISIVIKTLTQAGTHGIFCSLKRIISGDFQL